MGGEDAIASSDIIWNVADLVAGISLLSNEEIHVAPIMVSPCFPFFKISLKIRNVNQETSIGPYLPTRKIVEAKYENKNLGESREGQNISHWT